MPECVEKVRYEPCTTTVSRYAKTMAQPDVGLYKHLRGTAIVHGDPQMLSPKVRAFVEESVDLCQPENIHICDGTDDENSQLLNLMQRIGTIHPLPKYENCWLTRTNPADVARVEGKTFICTRDRREAIPTPKEGVQGTLGNWMSVEDMQKAIQTRFPGCMKGRTMYIIPFSMGPVGSPLAKIGVEITDSPYVVASMRIMTRVGIPVLDILRKEDDFVKCLHAVGGTGEFKGWPCDPENTIILHRPETNDIVSFGSGYGGNSLLGKKCFALRIGSTIAKREGWLAEHMLIVGVTNPAGKKRYIVAAFPSACGKTNMAMMTPTIPGYKVECVGDDIAWMKFDSSGQLRAINPENGFFGVAPGTSMSTNPNAMKTVFRNSVFTNVAKTSDGGVYWEGMEEENIKGVEITDWLGKPWTPSSDTPSSHPNSRFTAPLTQCPILDPDFEKHEGVPIDAILFGGRRPEGVPLVYESFSWQHGVFMGSSVSSETTAAAEHKGRTIMHDPFAMRPFFGYNFGHYMAHWLSLESREGLKLPKIYHVNWFRKGEEGKYLWPGFGENCRVVDWILRRLDGEDVACESPLGYIPKPDALNVTGIQDFNYTELFKIEKGFWMREVEEMEKYFAEQLPEDLPPPIAQELAALRKRIESL